MTPYKMVNGELQLTILIGRVNRQPVLTTKNNLN